MAASPKVDTEGKACKPCLDRHQEVGRLARTHQQAYGAAWYAQAAAAAQPPAAAYAQAAQEAEGEIWDAIVRNDRPRPATNGGLAHRTRQAHRPNRFGGRCGACNQWVEAGEGWLTGRPGAWGVAHADWEDGGCPAAPEDPGYDRDPGPAVTEPGVYVRVSDGRLVRVAFTRTTRRLVAFLCTLEEHGKDEYLGAGRHLVGLRPATLEEAAAYGKATVRCCVCGTRLENQESRDRGIGPV